MAQTTKSKSKRSTSRNSTQAKSSNRSGSSKSAGGKRKSSNNSRATSKGTGRKRSTSRRTAQAKSGANPIAEAASKARTPLLAGGTALIGVAAGAVLKDRLDSKGSRNPLRRLRGPSMPKSVRNADLSKIDLDTVKKAAERVSAYGQQASDIAAAVEKTRKKNS